MDKFLLLNISFSRGLLIIAPNNQLNLFKYNLPLQYFMNLKKTVLNNFLRKKRQHWKSVKVRATVFKNGGGVP